MNRNSVSKHFSYQILSQIEEQNGTTYFFCFRVQFKLINISKVRFVYCRISVYIIEIEKTYLQI